MIRRLAFVALAFLAAGCSGGGGGSASLPAGNVNAPAGGGSANAQVQITIPAPTQAEMARRVQFVSPGTQSLSFTALGGTPVVVALTSTTPGCTSNAGSLTCTVNVPLPVGANQTFTVATFSTTNGTGTPLSTNTVTQTIVAGQANPVSLTLGGVPSTVTLGVPTTAIPSVAATSIPVSVTVKDASGATIVGSDPFRNANGATTTITLSDTDASGGTTITPASLSAPGSATVAYDNYFQPTTAALTAKIGDTSVATAAVTFAAKPIVFMYNSAQGDTIVLGSNTGLEAGARQSALDRRRTEVNGLGPATLGALLPTGSSTAPYSLGSHPQSSSSFGEPDQTFNNVPFGMTTLPNGHLFFSEKTSSQFGFFDAGTTPAWPATSSVISPTATQTFGPVALGPGGKVYAAISGGFEQIDPATGLVIGAPVSVPSTFGHTISHAIAVGKDGNVYIEAFENTNGNNDDVLVFTASAAGFTFGHAFSTASSHKGNDAIFGIAVDSSNNVYISSDSNGVIDIVPASSQGEVVPARTISNANNIDDGANVLIDRAGNIIWAAYGTLSVYSPTAGSVPGNISPTTQFIPANDTPAMQTLHDALYTTPGSCCNQYNSPFILLTFGPGS